jgi:hypothetical protein
MKPLVEVSAVTLPELDAGRFVARSFDRPTPGESNSETYSLDVRGWAIGSGAGMNAVELVESGARLRRAPANVERPDVAATHPDPAGAPRGFYATLSSLALPARFELRAEAVLDDGDRALLGVIHGQRAPLEVPFEPRLAPLMVTSPGRTGSTIFMRLLEGHPEIVAYPAFEHEPRVTTYWLDVFRALSDPASYFRQINPAGPLTGHWWLGERAPVPRRLSMPAVQDWIGRESIEALGAFCLQRIDSLYGQIATELGAGDATYFAEKFRPDEVPRLVWELYPHTREVILVRDLRDVVCSIFASSAKRGVRELPADRSRYIVEDVKRRVAAAMHAWLARSDRAHLVRYEELMLEPHRVLRDLLDYLGLDSSDEAVEAMQAYAERPLAAMDDHRTTPDPRASIGRWRHELTPELVQTCERALAAFGYTA